MSKTIEQRFWDKVDKQKDHWLWTGSVNTFGYGQFKILNQMVYAHRLSYEFMKQEIPSTLQLDHTCEVKNCVNPDHLQPVTSKGNIHAGYMRKDPDWKPGKKFLLYIHNERFNDEKNKSGLVNMLLEKHYDTGLGKFIKHVEAESKIIKTAEQAQELLNPMVKQLKVPKKREVKYCKHGNPLGTCLDKKADRSCKP